MDVDDYIDPAEDAYLAARAEDPTAWLADNPLERMTPQTCPAGQHADWAVDSENAHACPWCRIAELEAEFSGEIEWSVGTVNEYDGKTVYSGNYTEADAREHAARRKGTWWPAWRRRTNYHRADNAAAEGVFKALREAAGKKPPA